MTTKVNIELTQKESNFREVSFSTNHPINLVEMCMKTRVWDDKNNEGSWDIEDFTFNNDGNSENCVWDGIINKWMLERNT